LNIPVLYTETTLITITQLINLQENKIFIFFRRLNPITAGLAIVEQVMHGVTFHQKLHFDISIGNILKICNQRIYLLRLLRDQGLDRHHLNAVFEGLILSIGCGTVCPLSVEYFCLLDSMAINVVFRIKSTQLRRLLRKPMRGCTSK